MSPDNFTAAREIFSRQRPFKPYTIEFTSGHCIEVDHPEAIMLHHALVAYRSRLGTYHLFDSSEVTRFIIGKVSNGQDDSTAAGAT